MKKKIKIRMDESVDTSNWTLVPSNLNYNGVLSDEQKMIMYMLFMFVDESDIINGKPLKINMDGFKQYIYDMDKLLNLYDMNEQLKYFNELINIQYVYINDESHFININKINEDFSQEIYDEFHSIFHFSSNE